MYDCDVGPRVSTDRPESRDGRSRPVGLATQSAVDAMMRSGCMCGRVCCLRVLDSGYLEAESLADTAGKRIGWIGKS